MIIPFLHVCWFERPGWPCCAALKQVEMLQETCIPWGIYHGSFPEQRRPVMEAGADIDTKTATACPGYREKGIELLELFNFIPPLSSVGTRFHQEEPSARNWPSCLALSRENVLGPAGSPGSLSATAPPSIPSSPAECVPPGLSQAGRALPKDFKPRKLFWTYCLCLETTWASAAFGKPFFFFFVPSAE